MIVLGIGYLKMKVGHELPLYIISKLSYEFTLFLIGVTLNIALTINFKSNSLIFSPEIGFSYLGIMYVFYGYNTFIDKNIFNMDLHKLTVGINLRVFTNLRRY